MYLSIILIVNNLLMWLILITTSAIHVRNKTNCVRTESEKFVSWFYYSYSIKLQHDIKIAKGMPRKNAVKIIYG